MRKTPTRFRPPSVQDSDRPPPASYPNDVLSVIWCRQRPQALGFKRADANVIIRLRELEVEEREDALRTMRTFYNALGVGGQGELFPVSVTAAPTRADTLN